MSEFIQQKDNSCLFCVRHKETGRGKTHSLCTERTGKELGIITQTLEVKDYEKDKNECKCHTTHKETCP